MSENRLPYSSSHILSIRRKSRIYPLLAVILAFGYGIFLASLPLEGFKDRVNYLVYAESSWNIFLRYWQNGILPTLTNEPLWLLLNSGLAKLFSPEGVLRVLIFVPAFVVAWLVLRYNPRQLGWLLIVLLLPQVVKNHIIHLRQGVAVAVFLVGWMTPRRSIRAASFAAAPFIHSSFFILLGLQALVRVMAYLRFGVGLRSILFVLAGVTTGLGLGWISSLFGARQAGQYDFSLADVSGLGFAFWMLVFVIWCFQGRTFLRQNSFESGVILFYLGTYFLVEVTARIFESALLVVLFAGLRLTGWRRLAFLALLLAYGTLQWVMRIGEPGLGFGVG